MSMYVQRWKGPLSDVTKSYKSQQAGNLFAKKKKIYIFLELYENAPVVITELDLFVKISNICCELKENLLKFIVAVQA